MFYQLPTDWKITELKEGVAYKGSSSQYQLSESFVVQHSPVVIDVIYALPLGATLGNNPPMWGEPMWVWD